MMATAKIVLWRIVGIDLVNAESRLGASLLDGVNPLAISQGNKQSENKESLCAVDSNNKGGWEGVCSH